MMKPGPVFATNANVPADGGGRGHIMPWRKLEGEVLQWDPLGRGISGPEKDPEHAKVRKWVGRRNVGTTKV